MFCSKCGRPASTEAQFCASCGAKLSSNQQVHTQQFAQPEVVTPAYQVPTVPAPKGKSGLGLGIAGLILGILSLGYGLSDFAAISDGTYSYILLEEIGILAIMSILGIAFGAVATGRKSILGLWGLVLSVLALLLTFFLSQFT